MSSRRYDHEYFTGIRAEMPSESCQRCRFSRICMKRYMQPANRDDSFS